MPDFGTFASFVNYAKPLIEALSVSVVAGKESRPTTPYVSIEQGVSSSIATRIDTELVRLRIVVSRQASEPIEVTMGNLVTRIRKSLDDTCFIERYDYTTSPSIQRGSFVLKYNSISPDISDDENVSQRVMQYSLVSVFQQQA